MGADSIQVARSMPNCSGCTKLPLSSLVYYFAKLIPYFKLVSYTLSTIQSRPEFKNSGHPNIRDLQVQKVKYEHFDLNLKRVYWFRDLSKYQFNSVWCLITKRVIELLQDQVKESKDHALQVFEHKSRVTDILHKYMSKRPVKKRDVKIMS